MACKTSNSEYHTGWYGFEGLEGSAHHQVQVCDYDFLWLRAGVRIGWRELGREDIDLISNRKRSGEKSGETNKMIRVLLIHWLFWLLSRLSDQ